MPAAPEGWAGPFENTYIFKLAERKTHTSFASAVARAQELGPEVCGGITKSGSRYSLRKPGPPLTHDLPTVSWCLEAAINFVASKPSVSDDGESDDVAAPKAVPKKVATKKTAPKKDGSKKDASKKDASKKDASKKGPTKKSTPKKALVVEPDAEPDAENDAEPAEPVEPEADNGVEPEAENGVEPDALDGEPDAENDVFNAETDDDGDGEEGLQVEQIEVDGVEYLFNPSSGEVYDYQHYIDNEEVKVLGTYDPESDQLELS